MRRFGGLFSTMKITAVTFGLGFLAIIGFPFLSGFYTKDGIIEAAFIGDGWRPWVFGLAAMLGAGVTAFYMSRLYFMTFLGKKRWTEDVHPHESPLTMTIPMMVLAVGSVGLGAVLVPTGLIKGWLDPALGVAGAVEANPVLAPLAITGLTLVLLVAGAGLAWMRYLRDAVPEIAPRGNLATQAARNDLYQDAVNEGALMRPGIHLTRSLVFTDTRGIDGAASGLGALIMGTSNRLRTLQNGYVRTYALTMLAGVVIIIGAVWVMQ